jgi:hypothetical protein
MTNTPRLYPHALGSLLALTLAAGCGGAAGPDAGPDAPPPTDVLADAGTDAPSSDVLAPTDVADATPLMDVPSVDVPPTDVPAMDVPVMDVPPMDLGFDAPTDLPMDRPVDAATDASDASVGDAGPAPFRPTVCSVDGWCWYHPTPQGNDLHGLWGSGSRDVWAVGDAGTALHWDGTRWSGTTALAPANLRAVWGAGPSNVWAVGDAGTALHWDGARWSRVDVGTVANLRGVWGSSASDVWIVGAPSVRAGTPTGAAIVHWDGSQWRPVAAPFVANLDGVWGSGASDVWVVSEGMYDAHWNGSAWTQVAERLGGRGSPMRAVAGSGPGNVYAVGDEPSAFSYRGGAVIWNREYAGLPTGTQLRGVWTSGPSDVWITGALSSSFGAGPAVSHWDGTAWHAMPGAAPYALNAVWGVSSADLWFAGDNGQLTHYDGVRFQSFTTRGGATTDSPTSRVFTSVWAGADGDAWATGPTAPWRWDGASWHPVAGPGSLTRVRGFATNDVWIMGDNNTLSHWNGTSLTNLPAAPINFNAGDLWGVSSRDFYVASGMGLFHSDGVSLTAVDTGERAAYTDVWGAAGELWVVRSRAVRHRVGSSWLSAVPSTYAASSDRLWGAAPGDLWLTHGNATLHWNGSGFVVPPVPSWASGINCSDAHGVSASDVWLPCTINPSDPYAPLHGPWMARWNGASFGVEDPGVGVDPGAVVGLSAVFARTADDVWAVGDRRAIVRRLREGSPDAGVGDAGPDATVDATADTGADATADAGLCNTVAYAGPAVAIMTSSAALPTPAGGTIADGTYALVSDTYYAGRSTSDTSRRVTARVQGGTLQVEVSTNGGADYHLNFSFSTSGSAFTMTPTCSPVPVGSLPDGFSASGATFALINSRNGEVQVFALASRDGGVAGMCNTLANISPDVAQTFDPSAGPSPSGGTILDGIYTDTTEVRYGSATGTPHHQRTTLQITGTTMQVVTSQDGGPDQRATVTLMASPGGALRLPASCPAGLTALPPDGYTASGSTLMLFTHNGATVVSTFTRQ